jgi:IS5 family transposase
VEHGYKGKGTLLHLIVDKNGKPLVITTTAANGNEREKLLDLERALFKNKIKVKNRMTILEADKGYDAFWLRQKLLQRGYFPFISYKKNQKHRVSSKIICKHLKIKSVRWVVERTFSWIKRKCRRLLLRWERLNFMWQAFALLGVIYMWLEILFG